MYFPLLRSDLLHSPQCVCTNQWRIKGRIEKAVEELHWVGLALAGKQSWGTQTSVSYPDLVALNDTHHEHGVGITPNVFIKLSRL